MWRPRMCFPRKYTKNPESQTQTWGWLFGGRGGTRGETPPKAFLGAVYGVLKAFFFGLPEKAGKTTFLHVGPRQSEGHRAR